MSKYIRSDARTEVEPEWMSIPHFLTWPDSSNWEEVKHMECGNFVSSVISRALFRYPSMFPSSLSKSAGSSELRHEFQARPRACMSPSTFCCCCLQRRISWILTKPRGLPWGMAPHKRNGEIPFLIWKKPPVFCCSSSCIGRKRETVVGCSRRWVWRRSVLLGCSRVGRSLGCRVVFVFAVYGRAAAFEKV